MIAVPLLAAALAASAADMPAIAPGQLEGRPAAADTSPLQALVDAASPGQTVEVAPGQYRGDLLIDKPLHLLGRGRPLLIGSGKGSVVRVRADDVTVEGVDIDGVRGGDLGSDSSGIHIAGQRAVVRDCHITDTLFGVYLRAANGARVEGNVIRGIPGKEPGEKGSGIHVWNTDPFTILDNDIQDTRDGFYIQSSSHGIVRGNSVRTVRYGLHYMYSDDNRFEENLFEDAAAGTVMMYSRRIEFRRNRFLHNRGFASVGLLFKACDDTVAEDNLIADNARGIFLEGSYRNQFRRNLIAQSDTAIVLYDSCGGVTFEGNAFLGNLTPLTLVGRRTDTKFEGNYWSGNDEPDLDGDGRSDRPYALGNLFDHLRGNLTAADLLSRSPAADALSIAERALPVLDAIEAVDPRPLARPPALPAVPRIAMPRQMRALEMAVSAAVLALGLVVLGRGRRRAGGGVA